MVPQGYLLHDNYNVLYTYIYTLFIYIYIFKHLFGWWDFDFWVKAKRICAFGRRAKKKKKERKEVCGPVSFFGFFLFFKMEGKMVISL